ncbi:MAG: hypothetical protein EA401_05295 [Planctomycetota bacterium]|nr:MAG: hypothetical protein EA401_05295 [Planctomycetota bacterium]
MPREAGIPFPRRALRGPGRHTPVPLPLRSCPQGIRVQHFHDSQPASDTITWVRSPEQLHALSESLAAAQWIAVDTESNSMFVYRERVCLIQLNIEGQLVLIDPFELPQGADGLGPLARALANPDQTIYLHGGEYDVVCLQRDYSLHIQAVFDTQQAASLLGWRKTGYGAVVEAVCEVKLPKGHSDYNWGKRPLDQDAISYAVDDVRYLPLVAQHLQAAISEADLDDEMAIANQAVEQVQARQPGYDPADIWRLKGVSDVPNKHLGVLVALHQWRDGAAQELDRPPGRVIPNDLLVALARVAPLNFGMLRRLRLRSHTLRDHGEHIIAQVQSALSQPPAIPEPPARREPDPQERPREQALKAWRKQEAERRGVTTQVVLPARALDYLKRRGAHDLEAVPQLGAKRIRLYGEQLRTLAPVPDSAHHGE